MLDGVPLIERINAKGALLAPCLRMAIARLSTPTVVQSGHNEVTKLRP
jgi:hypothetical protein